MAGHKSIGERLRKAKTLAVRREVALDWAADWQGEHDGLIAELERAIGTGRLAVAGQLLGQMKAMHAKRFGALPRVLDALSDEDIV